MIYDGQKSFRSQVSYVGLVLVLIISALIIVVWNSPVVAVVFAALGALWVAITLRSGITVTDDGFTVRGLLRTRRLAWAETDAFIVQGYSGSNRRQLGGQDGYLSTGSTGPGVVGLSLDAISSDVMTARVRLLSVVAVVTSEGERLRVHGTASTPMDPEFPAHAAAELNRRLRQHNSSATAG